MFDPADLAALAALAEENERSMSAENRLAIRNWIALHKVEVPTAPRSPRFYHPKKKGNR